MEATPDNMSLLLEHGGITAVFALGLLWMLQRVGMRLITAIDDLGKKIDSNTAGNAEMAARVSRLEGVLAGRESVTPIEGVPIVPAPTHPGVYGPIVKRKGTVG